MAYGDMMPFGDMGWTGTPGVMTYATGTQGGDATMSTGQSQGPGTAAPSPSCALCSNPKVMEFVFIIGVLFLLVGWHFHLFSMLED